MRMRRVSTFATTLILLGGLVGELRAQVTLDHLAIGSVAGTMSGGTVQLDLTLGQAAVGPILGGPVQGEFGFWWQVVPITTDVDHGEFPTEFALRKSVPNPFSTRTSLTYAIPRGPVPVFIGIFNLQGALVRTLVQESKSPGTYEVAWDGCDDSGRYVEAGVYFTKFRASSYQRTVKIIMLK